MTPGSIVQCRNREWVLMPSDQPDLLLLRPLTGATDELVVVHKKISELIGYTFPEERLRPATFPPPTPRDISDAAGAHLLWQAARLTLREGATPFRSLGRISIRPRTYQFVPLLMALRLDPVRLFIADDVGVGKTIEALLIARELLDRGEIKRLCVLCPPYLCDQWQQELTGKFNLDSVIIRSGTINQLERGIPAGGGSVFSHYPVQVVSIDFVKSDRKRANFLQHCPEFVVVDEAHGAACAETTNSNQQQRHELLKDLATRPTRHLVLLTATPHSGIPEAFRSLLALLRPEFAIYEVSRLSEPERIELARHFVQRTRKDIEADWETERCFPDRNSTDEHYLLSPEYQQLFDKTYAFCTELVRTGQSLEKRRQRVRYWAALALLRCVMSSPAAAVAALSRRAGDDEAEPSPQPADSSTAQDDVEFGPYIFESSNDKTDDSQPAPPVEAAEQTMSDTDRRKLRELARLAAALAHSPSDTKLAKCSQLVADLLRQGFQPIVWCRYIQTANYVAEGLRSALSAQFPDLRVVSITGLISDDERRAMVEELGQERLRVLVATDCLSEGINLQAWFNAVLHYDLPWNPNRLEQREGRVDRFGQTADVVKAIRYFSPDNPVDGVVISVLLDKAREIHRTLGTHVPVPEESETVTQAVLNALFFRGGRAQQEAQLELGLEVPEVLALHKRWNFEAAREKENRTRFAQRAIKPDEVRRELEATDAVLGDPDAVELFVLNACQRLGITVRDLRPATHASRTNHADHGLKGPGVSPLPQSVRLHAVAYKIACDDTARAALPPAIDAVLPQTKSGQWLVSFRSPTPDGAEYLGRNHRFVSTLAQFLMEEALTKGEAARASRCGVLRTRAVSKLTYLYLLRVRFLIEQPDRAPMLAEEVLVTGFEAGKGTPTKLPDAVALQLLTSARPDANVPSSEKQELVEQALNAWSVTETLLKPHVEARAADLENSRKRIRQAADMRVRQLKVRLQLPVDLLGLLVLQPTVTP